jgi:hypothetical protein
MVLGLRLSWPDQVDNLACVSIRDDTVRLKSNTPGLGAHWLSHGGAGTIMSCPALVIRQR